MGGGSASTKGVSMVISALIVTGVFLTIVSGLLAVQNSMQQAGMEALKREAERAMETPFQIFWLNDTHVRLFNNHSSVSITLKYWVTSGLTVSVIPLPPDDYSVPPGGMKDVKAADSPRLATSGYRVVSERGTVFVIGPPPSTNTPIFSLVEGSKLVRPGFNGLLTQIVLATGGPFNGGPVSITCIGSSPSPNLCSAWAVSFVPSSPVNVPSGGAVTVNVLATVPTGQSLGSYYLRFRVNWGGGDMELVLNVLVADFSISVGGTVTLLRQGCMRTGSLNVGTLGGYAGSISLRIGSVPDVLLVWVSPNPLDLSHGPQSTTIYAIRDYPATGTGFTTEVLTLTADDGLGPSKTATLVIVHRGTQAVTLAC